MAPPEMSDENRKLFLKHCQLGEVDAAKALLTASPALIDARSASKGYTAMHFAAMGGATSCCEWLETLGLTTEVESPDGTTPLQIAIEYKRLATARRLQQIRDLRRRGIDHVEEARLAAEEQAQAEAKARAEAEAEAEAVRVEAARR